MGAETHARPSPGALLQYTMPMPDESPKHYRRAKELSLADAVPSTAYTPPTGDVYQAAIGVAANLPILGFGNTDQGTIIFV